MVPVCMYATAAGAFEGVEDVEVVEVVEGVIRGTCMYVRNNGWGI